MSFTGYKIRLLTGLQKKTRDLDLSELKAAKLIVKTLHRCQEKSSREPANYRFETFAKEVVLDWNHILAMNLQQQLFSVCGVFYHACSGVFSENTDGKSETVKILTLLVSMTPSPL